MERHINNIVQQRVMRILGDILPQKFSTSSDATDHVNGIIRMLHAYMHVIPFESAIHGRERRRFSCGVRSPVNIA